MLDHLSEAQKRAYIIADNKLAENAGWDDELFRANSPPCRRRTSTSARSASRMRNWRGCSRRRTPPKDSRTKTRCPRFRKRQSRVLAIFGSSANHKLLVGDATNQDDVARLMAGDAADLVFTRSAVQRRLRGLHGRAPEDQRRPDVRRGVQAVPGSRVSLVPNRREARRLAVRLPLLIVAARVSERAGRRPASKFAVRSSGRRTRLPGVSAATNSSMNRCSTATSPARKIPGTATNRNRRCGRKTNPRRTASIRLQAGGADRARAAEQQQGGRHRRGLVRRVRLNADRLRAPRPQGAADGDRSEVRGLYRAALSGVLPASRLCWTATGGRSMRSPRSASRRPHESSAAAARSRPSKPRFSAAIPISPGCAWRSRTGRRNCASSRTRNAARTEPGGASEQIDEGSGFDGVAALAVLALGGHDGQAHLLADGAGQESAHGMRPASRWLSCSSFAGAPPGRFSRSRILAVLLPSRAPLAFFAPLGAFLAGLAFFPALAFSGATCARTCASGGLFGGFRLPVSVAAGAVSVLLWSMSCCFSFGGDYRGHDMDHSGAPGNASEFCRKSNEGRWNGDGVPAADDRR